MQSLETSAGAGLNGSIEACAFKSNQDGRAFMGRPLSLVSRLKQSSPWSVSTSPHFLFWNLQQACAYFTVLHSPHLYVKMILEIASDLHSVGFPDPPLLKVSELKTVWHSQKTQDCSTISRSPSGERCLPQSQRGSMWVSELTASFSRYLSHASIAPVDTKGCKHQKLMSGSIVPH